MRTYVRHTDALRRHQHSEPGNEYSNDDIVVDGNWSIFRKSDIYVNPLWALRKLNPSIYVPPSNYSHSSEILKNYHGWARLGSYDYYSGSLAGVVSHPVQFPTLPPIGYVRDQAIIKALKKLKDQNVNLALAYAEKEKTAAMMLSTAKSLSGAVRAIKKGDVKGACRALRAPNKGPSRIPAPKGADVPKRWLELQYGWKPLLSDVHGSARALADLVTSDPTSTRITVKGYAKSKELAFESITGNFEYSIFTKYFKSCGVRLDYYPPSAQGLMQASALGLTNPFDLAWELIPFSFMVDWFIPIGDVLNVMDAALPFDFLGGYITENVEARQQNLCAPAIGGSLNGTGYGEAYRHASQRVSLSSSPFPSLSFSLPKSPSTANVASALSIVASVFGK